MNVTADNKEHVRIFNCLCEIPALVDTTNVAITF